MHVLNLFDAIVWCKPDDLCWNATLLIAFPHSLWGEAKVWFDTVPRRKVMTWPQMMDCFLAQYPIPEKDVCTLCAMM